MGINVSQYLWSFLRVLEFNFTDSGTDPALGGGMISRFHPSFLHPVCDDPALNEICLLLGRVLHGYTSNYIILALRP